MVELFALADVTVTRENISQWLKKDNDKDFVACSDSQLAVFLNGFINANRGKRPGQQIVPEQRLTNNIILTKLKIALNLKADDIIELLASVDFRLSKPELSAFSRKVDHKHFRECKDQVLRNLLQAIDKKYHVARTSRIKSKDNNQPVKGQPLTKHKKESRVQGARPNASNIYQNPYASSSTKADKPDKSRSKLTLNKKSKE